MNKIMYQPNYWHYLTGDFFNHVYAPLRKVLPTLSHPNVTTPGCMGFAF